MHDTTVNNLKKLQEVISNSIKRSNECVQSCQDDSTPGNSYEAKIDLEELERITREFINDSGSISEKEILGRGYAIALPMEEQLVKNLQKLEEKISNFIQCVDNYNQLERDGHYPALFQHPGENDFITLGEIVQEPLLGMTSENSHNNQEIESEDNEAIDNRLYSEQNIETLDSESAMNVRDLILKLQARCQNDPELLKKFQAQFREHLRAKQGNLPQDTLNSLITSSNFLNSLCSVSSELYSWGTNWDIDSINDSLSNDQEGQPQDVHAILSRWEYLLYDSLLSITNSPSVYEQKSSQTGLENNLISMQRSQLKRSLSYDVNNKIFDSIEGPLFTRNDSLSNNGVIQKDWSEKDVQQDYTWVFPSSEEVNSSSARQVRQEANVLNSKRINQEKEHFSLPSYLLKQPSNLHIDNNSLTTDLTSQVSQLAKELGDAKQDLSEKISEINRKNDIILAQQVRVNNFTIEKNQLKTQNQGLNDENKKLSAVNTQSKKQGNCASISFVLSGAFAIGASSTIPYLAVCVALAVAASISLIVGCCCLYKANTALNNVELDLKDKGANSVSV